MVEKAHTQPIKRKCGVLHNILSTFSHLGCRVQGTIIEMAGQCLWLTATHSFSISFNLSIWLNLAAILDSGFPKAVPVLATGSSFSEPWKGYNHTSELAPWCSHAFLLANLELLGPYVHEHKLPRSKWRDGREPLILIRKHPTFCVNMQFQVQPVHSKIPFVNLINVEDLQSNISAMYRASIKELSPRHVCNVKYKTLYISGHQWDWFVDKS